MLVAALSPGEAGRAGPLPYGSRQGCNAARPPRGSRRWRGRTGAGSRWRCGDRHPARGVSPGLDPRPVIIGPAGDTTRVGGRRNGSPAARPPGESRPWGARVGPPGRAGVPQVVDPCAGRRGELGRREDPPPSGAPGAAKNRPPRRSTAPGRAAQTRHSPRSDLRGECHVLQAPAGTARQAGYPAAPWGGCGRPVFMAGCSALLAPPWPCATLSTARSPRNPHPRRRPRRRRRRSGRIRAGCPSGPGPDRPASP
ncbi:hypothetical protein SAMN05216252_119142 [Actinacidiphila glaucinigra]|uniref:Uncharacterized protein n=1 Tax=Actinacidiphila glaucinigra TaxID=235986 RepID=A0A239LHX7_9ACTN|nr:hypothetical protein SAMN05216252_119142 [Actinacidiphila glaucinigra]